MNAVTDGGANPSSETTVLHLVGGVGTQGGLMSFVRSITHEPLPGFEQLVWKHRQYPGEEGNILRRGWCREVDRNIIRDVFGAFVDFIPLYFWLRRQRVVVIHVHSRTGTILSAFIRLVRPVPIIVHTHSRWRQTAWHRLLWRLLRAPVVFNSRMTCVHYGFAPETSNVLTPTIPWPAPPPAGKGRFVACGHIVRLKNIHLIIEAFLLTAKADQSLDIYGFSPDVPEPDYQDKIVRMAKPHPNICLHQWDSRWMDSLCQDDIFVHAANGEAFGIVMLEAYARGCRMVVPHGTFLKELPFSGIFESALTSPALAESMVEACGFPSSVELWRQRQAVARLFSLENTRHALSQIYRQKLQMN